MRIGYLQYDTKWLDKKANLQLISKTLSSQDQLPDLLLLPEMCLSGFSMEPELAAIEEIGPEVDFLQQLCSQYQLTIAGSFAIDIQGNRFVNRILVINENGIDFRYDKQYLFSPSGEHNVYSTEQEPALYRFHEKNVLFQICYDLRFPELPRSFHNVDLIVYSANWPSGRINHWDQLLSARAIENQCYVLACNRSGMDGNQWEYPGHSQIVQFDGTYISGPNTKEEMVSANIDFDMQDAYRRKFPFLADRQIN